MDCRIEYCISLFLSYVDNVLFSVLPHFHLFSPVCIISTWLILGFLIVLSPLFTTFFLVPLSLSPTLISYFLTQNSFVSAHPGGNVVQCLRMWALDWDLVGAGLPLLFISCLTLGNSFNFSVSWFNFWYDICKAVMNW